LNSSLRWGIELLVNGDGIGEHISRFTSPNGKYVALVVKDYTVVDICRNSTRATNISRHSNRITVFFKDDDYSIAQCIFGLDNAPVVIRIRQMKSIYLYLTSSSDDNEIYNCAKHNVLLEIAPNMNLALTFLIIQT
jgi:hypothetical protein